jgi:hypothetical protein
MASDEKKFPSKITLFSLFGGKSFIQPYPSYTKIKHLRRYAGQNEERFKVTDKKMETSRETAAYLYENNLIEKSNTVLQNALPLLSVLACISMII